MTVVFHVWNPPSFKHHLYWLCFVAAFPPLFTNIRTLFIVYGYEVPIIASSRLSLQIIRSMAVVLWGRILSTGNGTQKLIELKIVEIKFSK